MRTSVKADLLGCLEADLPEHDGVPLVDAKILDGAAVVNMINPGTSKRCLHITLLPNSRRTTVSTFSGMFTVLQG